MPDIEMEMHDSEIERLRTAMRAAYDVLHDDNDADGAERILRVALQGAYGSAVQIVPSIRCPRCGFTSYNLGDIEQGYCARCNDWTRIPSAKSSSSNRT